jgi:predicted kinase
MAFPTYDIVKKERKNFVWVDAPHDIESAKRRVYELSRNSDAEFVIFNEQTLQVAPIESERPE